MFGKPPHLIDACLYQHVRLQRILRAHHASCHLACILQEASPSPTAATVPIFDRLRLLSHHGGASGAGLFADGGGT